jgi:hypothetical protein
MKEPPEKTLKDLGVVKKVLQSCFCAEVKMKANNNPCLQNNVFPGRRRRYILRIVSRIPEYEWPRTGSHRKKQIIQ